MGENEHGLVFFAPSYFSIEGERLEFLPRLFEDGHSDEAMTLCLVYIDRYAQLLLWSCDKSNRRLSGKKFVNALVTFGGDPILALIHPVWVIRQFKKKSELQQIACRLKKIIFPGPNYELLIEPDFLAKLATSGLSSTELDQVKPELWRGTIAAVAYYLLRNPSTHKLGAVLNTSFAGSTYGGEPVPDLNFKRLHNAAAKLLDELRRRTDETGQLFGNDRIVRDE
jgi:hypothetical protein